VGSVGVLQVSYSFYRNSTTFERTMVNFRSGPSPPSFLFIWDQARWVWMVSRAFQGLKRATFEFAISTRDYYFGPNSLEVRNRFIESKDFCRTNDLALAAFGGVKEVKRSRGKLPWLREKRMRRSVEMPHTSEILLVSVIPCVRLAREPLIEMGRRDIP